MTIGKLMFKSCSGGILHVGEYELTTFQDYDIVKIDSISFINRGKQADILVFQEPLTCPLKLSFGKRNEGLVDNS